MLRPALGLALSSGIAVLLAVAACSAPGSSKPELQVCTPGQAGCVSTGSSGGNTSQGDGTTGETPSDPPPPAAPTPAPRPASPTPDAGPPPSSDNDAGTPAPTLGPECTRLKSCCDYFVANGILADFCLDALNSNVESTCEQKYESYQNDPETGGSDCPGS